MMKKTFLLSLPIVAFAIALMNVNAASAFSNVYPDPGDSSNLADVVAVSGETRYVTRTDGTIRVWFPNNSGTVEIRNGNFCNGIRGDYSESEDSTYASWGDGADITVFNVVGTTQSFTGKKGINCSASHTFKFNNIPEDSVQGYYRDIKITYKKGNRRGPMNSFSIVAPGQPNVRIGLIGDNSGFQATQDQVDATPANTQYRVPFGAPCRMTGPENAELNFFDLDNAGGSGAQLNGNITVRLYDRTSQSYVNFNGVAGTTWTPPSRNDINQSISFTARPGHKYRLEINNVYHNNTIQYSIPYDQIFSEPCPPAQIVPKATVNGSTTTISRSLGSSLTFRNWATTSGVGSAGSDTFQLSVVVTQGTVPGGAYGPVTRQLAPARDIPDDRRALTFTPAAVGTYCLETRVRNVPSYVATPQGLNSRICATITAPPPPAQRIVTVTPYVNGGPDIEPTETTTLNGRVDVSGFPSYTDWGYYEYSMQANPVSQPASQGSYGSSNSYYDTPSASKGGCSFYNSKGVCTQWYWYCAGSYAGSGSSAPSCPSRYRHTCNTSGSWVDTSWSGTCYDIWYCPYPTGGTYYRTSAPACNVWRCPYSGASNYYSTSPSKFDCQFRCLSGTGPVAYAGSPWSRSQCYQQPKFTLECSWSSGLRTSSVVTNNGTYCQSSVSDVGRTIGVPVCAILYTEYPSGWSQGPAGSGYGSFRQPGYGSTDNGASYRQLTTWGWTNPPPSASGCTQVVGKPTVKILGGDAAVGGSFPDMASGIGCSGGTSASIIGWPHSPVYNAAGGTLAAFASQDIQGFATATLDSNGFTMPPSGLAFANTSTYGERYGGNFGTMPCLGDHWFTKPANLPNRGLGSLNSPNTNGTFVSNSGSINGNPTIANGNHVAFYVEGNVTISGTGIRYQRNGGWATVNDIPSFKLVVYGGNIYIEPGVTQLDGIYVAQPKAGVGGHIYTCASGGSEMPASSRYNSCHTPLTVNGSFVAKQVHLGRTTGTAIRGETAEQFNYLPELWVSQWPQDNTATEVKYDAILSLPPVL